MVHHSALGASPNGGPLPPTGFLPLPLRMTAADTNTNGGTCITTPTTMATDPAAAVAAAMMQGMRLPLALTKKQMKSEMSVQNHSNSNGRISPAQEEKEGKSKPIHCVIEHASPPSRPVTPPSAKSNALCETNVELDTYAILSSNTLFSEIVRVALVKLGYTAAEAIGAKGAIQIRNWKPLTFDTITENPDATVDEILGDLTSVATLRIKLGSRAKSHSVDGVKEKLLQFLLQHSQSMLMSTGCPIDKNFLAAIGKGEYPATMPDDMRRSFERWYREQTRQAKGSPVSSTASSPESGKENRFDGSVMFGPHFSPASAGYPALRGELNTTHFSRTRIRTSFDPDLEIPRLQRWFEQNQHPTRDQMIFYLNELNSLESRRGRKPLDLTNIIYWFKNARAAQRRAHRSPEPDNTADGEPFKDSSIEERLSPEPVKNESSRSTSPTASEHVPVLPNRNAVYVVNEPLHMYKKEDLEGDSNVLHIEPEEPVDQKSPPATAPNDMDQPKNSPRESNDSGNGSDADQSAPLVIEPQSPASVPQNLTVGVKRSSECLESDISEDEFDEENDREPTYNGQFHGEDKYKPRVQSDMNGGSSDRGSPPPSGSSDNRMSPLVHSGVMPSHPLLTPPNLGSSTMSPHHQQPPPAHQQALGLHHPHLPHPLNMHLFPHPLYNPIDASALMANAPRPFKDSSSPTSLSEDHRKKRSRVFIDPLTEIPKLEKWFIEDTHPSSYMIEKYTEDLNRSEYRQRFPKLEPKNVQLWFKNHRAKVKRQRFEHSAELMQQHNNAQPAEVHSSAQ